MSQDRIVVDLKWLAQGEEDPHPRYVEIGRDDLAGAHLLSDDELAYSLSMMSTISDEQDAARMVDSHRNGGDYIHKSLLGEIAKDRLRWLSRRIAVLEGRYPGSDKPKGATMEQLQALCKEKALHLDLSYSHQHAGWISQWVDGVYTLPALVDAVIEAIQAAHPDTIIRADEPLYVPREPIDSPEMLQEYIAEARLQQQIPLLVGWLGITEKTTHKKLVEALALHNVKVDAMKVGLVVGFSTKGQFGKRWQVYVSLMRDLLKQGIYIPFYDDAYVVDPKGLVHIKSSKYHGAGRQYKVRIRIEPGQKGPQNIVLPAAVVDATHRIQDQFFHEPTPVPAENLDLKKEAIEAMAEDIYDSWSSKDGWTPWVAGGNSDMQVEARREAAKLIGG